MLSVVDAFRWECLALEVDTGFASRRVTRVLEEIIAVLDKSQAIRCDNGLELNSCHFPAWALGWSCIISSRKTNPEHARGKLPRPITRESIPMPFRQTTHSDDAKTLGWLTTINTYSSKLCHHEHKKLRTRAATQEAALKLVTIRQQRAESFAPLISQ